MVARGACLAGGAGQLSTLSAVFEGGSCLVMPAEPPSGHSPYFDATPSCCMVNSEAVPWYRAFRDRVWSAGHGSMP